MIRAVKVKSDSDETETEVHIWNEPESGRYEHSLHLECDCGPTVEHVNEGEGWIVVHQSLDEVRAVEAFAERAWSGHG